MFYQILYEVINYSEEMYEMVGGYFTASGILFSAIFALSVKAVLFIVYYSLRSVAVYGMSKRNGLKNLWLAFIPCGYFYLLGRLQDDSMPSSKRNPIYTWTAVVSSALYVVFGILLEIFGALPTLKAVLSAGEMEEITRNFIVITPFTKALSLAMGIVGLSYGLSAIIIYINVYRAYAPQKAVKYSIIAVAVDVLFSTSLFYGIFLFKIRNNQRTGYAGYARAKASFYGGGFGGYGNYYGGNGSYGNVKPEQKENTEPFEEFSSKDDTFTGGNGDGCSETENNGFENYNQKENDDSDDLFS